MPAPNPQKKSVAQIKSTLLRPATTSHFQCWFNPPQAVRDWTATKESAGIGKRYDDNFAEFLSLHCSEASLPGSSFATHEVNNDFTGVTERYAYRRLYDDRADFTFYVDHDYTVLNFFENWMTFIANEQVSNGVERRPEFDRTRFDYHYRMNYPKDYITDAIYIHKFEKDYRGRYLRYRFIKAFPISINSIPVSYDSSTLLKCTVSFTYQRYIISGEFDATGGGDSQANGIGLSPQQQAVSNSLAFNPVAFSTPTSLANPLQNAGGVSFPAAQASGNTTQIAFGGQSFI